MAIEKALYTNGADTPTAEEIEIEIVNPEEVTISTDDMELSMGFDEGPMAEHDSNLVDFMEQSELDSLEVSWWVFITPTKLADTTGKSPILKGLICWA